MAAMISPAGNEIHTPTGPRVRESKKAAGMVIKN